MSIKYWLYGGFSILVLATLGLVFYGAIVFGDIRAVVRRNNVIAAYIANMLQAEEDLEIVHRAVLRYFYDDDSASRQENVFGYTIGNDVTARDRQVRTSPEGSVWYELGRSKSFDCSAPLGPVIVTADEIGDPKALKVDRSGAWREMAGRAGTDSGDALRAPRRCHRV